MQSILPITVLVKKIKGADCQRNIAKLIVNRPLNLVFTSERTLRSTTSVKLRHYCFTENDNVAQEVQKVTFQF